jgi:hypothetical protein
MIARWQRWMLEWRTVVAPMPAALEIAFVPSTTGEYILIRTYSTLQVAGDFIRVYRSGDFVDIFVFCQIATDLLIRRRLIGFNTWHD